MKLNHLNLPVENVIESRNFFEQYFDFECMETKGDNMLAVLRGTDGFTLVLMDNRFNRQGNNSYPDALHIGFFVHTKEEVLAIYHRLKAGNIELAQEPGSMRGVFGFYFHAPGNILTEISSAINEDN